VHIPKLLLGRSLSRYLCDRIRHIPARVCMDLRSVARICWLDIQNLQDASADLRISYAAWRLTTAKSGCQTIVINQSDRTKNPFPTKHWQGSRHTLMPKSLRQTSAPSTCLIPTSSRSTDPTSRTWGVTCATSIFPKIIPIFLAPPRKAATDRRAQTSDGNLGGPAPPDLRHEAGSLLEKQIYYLTRGGR